MTRKEYDAIKAANYSTVKLLIEKTPRHYKDALDKRAEEEEAASSRDQSEEAVAAKEESQACKVGQLAHAMVLEGRDLRDLYAIKPAGMSFAKKDGKEWRDAQTLPIITQEEADGIPRMAEAIVNDPYARTLLELCPSREHAIVTEIGGIKVKCLLDAYGSSAAKVPLILDVKTGRDVSPRGFGKAINDRDYDMQCEYYSWLARVRYALKQPPEFSWIAVENKRPFVVQCYYPDEECWKSGRRKVSHAFDTLLTCTKNDEWPAYGGGLQPISIPAWATKRFES